MNLIKLEQTNNHYLLTIPQSIKMRAKKISPRQWDPERLVWVYPRNEFIYESLLNEFETDLGEVQITPPAKISNKNVEAAHQQISKLKKKIKLLENDKGEMETEIEGYISMIGDLSLKIEKKDKEIDLITSIEMDAKMVAKATAGNDSYFNNVIDKVEFNDSLPVEISKPIKKRLKKILKVNDEKIKFYTLINQGEKEKILNEEACSHLHNLRKQRNKFAHISINPKTKMAMVISAIMEASMAWYHINYNSNR